MKINDLIFRMHDPVAPAALIGGKGRNLAILAQRGLRVPPFVVLTVEAFAKVMGNALREIDLIAASCRAGLAPAAAARQIQEKIANLTFPAELEQEILASVRDMLGGRENTLVAVRSSAVDEDSSDHSFAGQLDSYLFQKPDGQLVDAIKGCMASAFNERAIVYRLSNGLPLAGIRAAVVIQEMIFGDVSGVAFTANPINNNPEQYVIDGVFGAGEGLVSGELDSDTWVMDPHGTLWREEVRDKAEMIVFDEARGFGTVKVAVPAAQRQTACLTKESLLELVALCRRIENDVYSGQPQDIEWCLRNGELYILQARPIAAFSKIRKNRQYVVFDNSDLVESYAGLPTPLTFSFASASFKESFKGLLVRLGTPQWRLRELETLHVNLLGLVHGRMYYNLLNWYRYLLEMPIGGDPVKEYDLLIGVTPDNALVFKNEFKPGLWRTLSRWMVGLRMRWKVLTIGAVARDFERHFYKKNGKYVNEFFRTQSNPELIDLYRGIFENGSPYWDGELVNFIGAQRAFAALAKILGELGINNVAGVQNDLIGGDGEIASMRPTREMMAIADMIRENEAWRVKFMSSSVEELRMAVLGEPAGTEGAFAGCGGSAAVSGAGAVAELAPVRRRIEALLEEYGCRCMNELKLEEPTYREDPSFVLATIKSYVAKKPAPVEKQLEGQLETRHEAERLVFGRAGLWQRLQLRWYISRVRKHVYYREELRLVRGKYWGMVRRLFYAIGRNLEAQGILANWRDIFMLKVDEVAELVEGRSPDLGHVPELVILRKKSYAENAERAGHSRVYAYGDICALDFVYSSSQAGTGAQPAQADDDGVMRGIACGPGVARGEARVAISGDAAMGLDGEILVAERTDPGWIPLYPSISGLVIERGSVLSHSAVVAREMGIPTVVGIQGATRKIRSGDHLVVDGTQGTVEIVTQTGADSGQAVEKAFGSASGVGQTAGGASGSETSLAKDQTSVSVSVGGVGL